MRREKIFGVDSPAATALAQALWANGPEGKVKTGAGSTGANFVKTRDAWVLHNTGWWCWGGARDIVNEAAITLIHTLGVAEVNEGELRETPKICLEWEREWLGQQKLEKVLPEHRRLVWEVAVASYDAWFAVQQAKWEEQEAERLGLSLDVLRLTHTVSRGNATVPKNRINVGVIGFDALRQAMTKAVGTRPVESLLNKKGD